ncbi:MAG: hypothetical protein GX336_03230 [Halanaerobiaceae bacterium]|nr:hypothetical protein [Halanaerobiaceae bacterium]
MNLYVELETCILAIESLKNTYLEKLLLSCADGKGKFEGLLVGQYIAYASCQSMLTDLLNKYKEEKVS